MSTRPDLTAVEARVLAVLVEKERTVPDTYPLSLNALVSGCNQKSSRDPVMEVSETDAREAPAAVPAAREEKDEGLRARIEALEARVAELQAQFDALRENSG